MKHRVRRLAARRASGLDLQNRFLAACAVAALVGALALGATGILEDWELAAALVVIYVALAAVGLRLAHVRSSRASGDPPRPASARRPVAVHEIDSWPRSSTVAVRFGFVAGLGHDVVRGARAARAYARENPRAVAAIGLAMGSAFFSRTQGSPQRARRSSGEAASFGALPPVRRLAPPP